MSDLKRSAKMTDQALLLSFVGSILFLFGAVTAAIGAQKRKNWLLANGVVVEIKCEERQNPEGGTTPMYAPIVEYISEPTKAKVRFQDPIWSVPVSHEIGANIEVLYNPQGPDQALINSQARIYFIPAISMTLGIILILAVLQK
jgi:hypothetical protein